MEGGNFCFKGHKLIRYSQQYNCYVCFKRDLKGTPFYCHTCKFGLCPDCCKLTNIQRFKIMQKQGRTRTIFGFKEGISCSEGHKLVFYQHSYSCDVCLKRDLKGTPLHCHTCNFDICPDCSTGLEIPQNNQNNNMSTKIQAKEESICCLKDHKLVPYQHSYSCNVCFQKGLKGTPLYCHTCDFDVCPNCCKLTDFQRFQKMFEYVRTSCYEGKEQFKKISQAASQNTTNILDSIFRPDNEKRRKEVIQLASQGFRYTSQIYEKLTKVSQQMNSSTFEKIKAARLSGARIGDFGFVANAISIFSTVSSGLIGVCAFLVGGAAVTWPILVFFVPVGAVMKGLEVHQRYTQFEQILSNLRPVIRQLKKQAQTVAKM